MTLYQVQVVEYKEIYVVWTKSLYFCFYGSDIVTHVVTRDF